MKMKDKLVKFHHKGSYYRVKKFFIAVVAVFSLGSMIAIPTYIFVNSSMQKTTKADDNVVVDQDFSNEEAKEEFLQFEENN